jgi:general secretion pathway protein N
MAGAKLMSAAILRGVLVALVVSSAAAGASAVPTAPVDLVADQVPAGNPLWAIPLRELSATRERPIFSASRRPPAPAVAAAPYTPPLRAAKPAEPDRPQLSLVGTIAGDNEGFGIFLDRSANSVLRLRTGEEHKGWVLREVRSRETVLEKDEKTVTLALPALPRAVPITPARR